MARTAGRRDAGGDKVGTGEPPPATGAHEPRPLDRSGPHGPDETTDPHETLMKTTSPGEESTTLLDSPDQGEQVARIVHELRSPLAATLQAIDLLERTPDLPPDPTLLGIARRQLTSGLRRVEQLLLLLSGEGDHAPAAPEPHRLYPLVTETVASRPHPDDGTTVAVEVDPELVVNVDRFAFEQILDNLLTNALRHAPPDSVVRIGSEPRPGEVWLDVTDRGPGIDPAVAATVFEPFVRGTGGGAGLGLAIVRQLAESQGGRVWIEEGLARGTRVVVALPRP
jgi:two-component system, OmpR family, sensor kinase